MLDKEQANLEQNIATYSRHHVGMVLKLGISNSAFWDLNTITITGSVVSVPSALLLERQQPAEMVEGQQSNEV